MCITTADDDDDDDKDVATVMAPKKPVASGTGKKKNYKK